MENLDSILAPWTRSPSWVKLATLLALPTAGFLYARVLDDYREWFAQGAGGLPHNAIGYFENLLLTALVSHRDTKALALYDRPASSDAAWSKASEHEKKLAQTSFLKTPLPQREGPRAEAFHHCAPQREKLLGAYFDPEVKKKYLAAFDALVDEEAAAIEMKTSSWEKHCNGIFLKPTYADSSLTARARRELAHVHANADMSAHVVLSIADAREVVAKGWGERQRMSGSRILPLGYTFLYLPRNKEEVDVLIGIFEAGIQYAKSNGKA